MEWTVNSQSVANNTSNVTVKLKIQRTDGYPSYGAYNNNANNTITLTVGGTQRYSTSTAKIDTRGSGQTLATWTGDVGHNADGTLNLALQGYFYFNSSGASSLSKGGYTISTTAAIATIPRKSSVSCTSGNVGESVVITIARASSSFTHTLTYSFGSLSGTIATKTSGANVGWTLPTSFYAQMPTTASKVGTITCETFNGTASLGTTTCSFTARVSVATAPNVYGTVVDSNTTTVALTGDSSKLIKFYSTALATITASANASATLSQKQINGITITGNTYSFTNVETNAFQFAAKDSRGMVRRYDVTSTMIPYIKLTANATATRTSQTGDEVVLTVKGNYYNGSFGVVTNTLGINYRFREVGTTAWSEEGFTPTISGNTYTASATLTGFDYQKVYEFEVSVIDQLSDEIATATVVKGEPIADWGKNDFNFNVPVTIQGNNVVASGSNSNGNYVKLYDGTMICYKMLTIPSAGFTAAWGAWYQCPNYAVGSFAESFISAPICSLSEVSDTVGAASCVPFYSGSPTTAAFPSASAVRPTSATMKITFLCMAVGRWKA